MRQADLLRKVAEAMEAMGISYYVVGSYGSGAWGEPRFTEDIDVVVFVDPDDAWGLARAFPEPDYYVSIAAIRQAIANHSMFNVIDTATSDKADLIVSPRDHLSKLQLSRRRMVEFEPGLKVYVASPEDVILGKLQFYREGGSEKHLRDIAGIVRVQADALDRGYVAEWADRLGVAEIWQAILRRLSRPDR